MKPPTFKTLIAVVALLGVVVACWFLDLPLPLAAVFLLAAAAMVAAQISSLKNPQTGRRWLLMAAWAGSVAALLAIGDETELWSVRLVIVPFLLAALAWLVSRQFSEMPARRAWLGLAMFWAWSGEAVWLATSYFADDSVAFYSATMTSVGLLIVCKKSFSLPAAAIQALNSVMLLLIGLPLASWLISGLTDLQLPPDPAGKYYTYDVAMKHPKKFEMWWNYFWTQWRRVSAEIQVRDNHVHNLPFRLKPDSHLLMMQSQVDINSRGFRGREFPEDKGNAYRIVALGESTTFGITYTAADKPWPEWLEQMINERLKPARPVEVINAGIASYDLKNNLIRLGQDILPLKPDMIISYHGINGFRFIDSSLPPLFGAPPPPYEPRPVKLLADAEYKFKVMRYDRAWAADQPTESRLVPDPMDSEYARVYRQVIQLTQTNHVHLVLATYSMAVNGSSDPKVVDFYARTFRRAAWAIKANEAHTKLLEGLAREYPDVSLVDTHPGLDGQHDEFIDIVHFSEDGERRMAENVFAGISNTLKGEISSGAARQ